jgi:hypothetical protein
MSKASSSCSNAVYGLGLFGALIYNMQYAEGFSQVLWGLFKSFFWPAFLIYQVLTTMQI